MEVALYLKHFPANGAPLAGGTSIAVDGLAAGLAANGARVTVLCEGRERRTVGADGGYTIECFANARGYRTFTLAPELGRYVATRLTARGDMCLVNGMFHPGAYAMGRLLHRHGVPYVVAPHSTYNRAVFRKNAHLKWPYWYLFERGLLERAQAIQVFDASHGTWLRELGVATAFIESANGIAPGSVPAESQLRWSARGAPANLLFFGRIDADTKGLDLLLDACARVAAWADVRVTVQGPDGGDRAALEKRAARLAISDRAVFRGPDYERPPPQVIGEYDVLCLPSRSEGFGLTGLEAMLAARVLLVSERAGIARHVRASDCGIAVRPAVAGIEAGLRTLFGRRAKWREMGLRGRRYALTNLQWQDIARDVLAQYAALARRP